MKHFKQLDRNSKVKIILLGALIVLILALASIFSVFLSIVKKSPETNFSSLRDSFPQTSTIYDSQDHFIEDLETREARTMVSLDKVPKDLSNAFLAIEDRKFYQHKGLDVRSILSSLKSNLVSGQIVRGGSTISQQLVKNSYLSSEKSLERKIQEAYLTMRMEEELDKEEILELYLNRIDLGFGSYGVQTAARNYFSKDVKDLTLAESALLAGIVKSPAKYQPILRIPVEDIKEDNPNIIGRMTVSGMDMALVKNKNTFDRQALVLKVMEEAGYISSTERQKALKEEIRLNPYLPEKSPYSSYVSDYISDQAALELSKIYSISLEEAKKKVTTGGYKIYSTLDGQVQKDLEDIFKNFSKNILSRAKNHGANFLSFSLDPSNNILDNSGKVLFFQHNNLYNKDFDLVLSNHYFSYQENKDLVLSGQPFQIFPDHIDLVDTYSINREGNLLTNEIGALHLTNDQYKIKDDKIIIPKSTLDAYPDMFVFSEETLTISSDYFDYSQNPTLQPQASVLISDNRTGAIKAFIGGLDLETSNKRLLNRLYSQRQPGTALSPFSVYLPALEEGESLGNVYDDVPQITDGQIWPLDPKGNYEGYINIKRAIGLQKPSIAVQLLKAHGIDSSLASLHKLGFYQEEKSKEDKIVSPQENKEKNDFNLDSLALGNLVDGVDTPSLMRAYQAIANQGKATSPFLIRKIVTPDGKVLLNKDQGPTRQVMKEEEAFLLRDALESTLAAKRISKDLNRPFFGLLGENKFNSDYFLLGSTPENTIGLWLGPDSPKISLSKDPLLVTDLAQDIVGLLGGSMDFPQKPASIIEVEVSSKTGLLANSPVIRSGTSEKIYYKKGLEPKEESKSYTRKLVCSVSNMLANQYCPDENIVARYYFVRPKGYQPEKFGGIYPNDYYSVPNRYCNVHDKEWQQEQEKEDKEKNKEEDEN